MITKPKVLSVMTIMLSVWVSACSQLEVGASADGYCGMRAVDVDAEALRAIVEGVQTLPLRSHQSGGERVAEQAIQCPAGAICVEAQTPEGLCRVVVGRGG